VRDGHDRPDPLVVVRLGEPVEKAAQRGRGGGGGGLNITFLRPMLADAKTCVKH